jgi:very-short-patch-repair endonuclease
MSIRHLPFDFCIEEHKIIIELDGEQHFKQVLNWSDPETQMKNDVYKMNCAFEEDFNVIRIERLVVWNNKKGWIEELINNINDIINNTSILQMLFIQIKNNMYDNLTDMYYGLYDEEEVKENI